MNTIVIIRSELLFDSSSFALFPNQPHTVSLRYIAVLMLTGVTFSFDYMFVLLRKGFVFLAVFV